MEGKNIIGIVTAGRLAFMAACLESERQLVEGRAHEADLAAVSAGAVALLGAAEKLGAFMARNEDEFDKSAAPVAPASMDAAGMDAAYAAMRDRLKVGYYCGSPLPSGLYLKSEKGLRPLERFAFGDGPSEEFMREFWSYFEKLFSTEDVSDALEAM